MPATEAVEPAAGEALDLAQALAEIDRRLAVAVPVETVPLRAAAGRYLAADVVAARDVPGHANAAVDGYAVRVADCAPGARLRLAARTAAGASHGASLAPGTAARVFTGAPLAAEADAVIAQEDARIADGHLIPPPGVRPGANRREAGEDMRAGAPVLAAGARLRATDLAALAAQGIGTVAVRARLKVAVLSTGDEVREPGRPLDLGCVFDANRTMIVAALDAMGCDVADGGIVRDEARAVRDALAEAARGRHLVITSGAVSAGEEDHVKAAVAQLGAIHLWRLAIRPGRPLAFGRIGDAAFIGLPGNPVAVAVTLLRIAQPAIAKLAGGRARPVRTFPVRAGFAYPAKKPGRREWLRARLRDGADGVPVAEAYPAQGSAIVSSLVFADGLVELPEAMGPVAEGAVVPYLPFEGLLP